MRRKRKVWYEIQANGMWWCGNKIGWIKDSMLNTIKHNGASSTRSMRAARKAFAHLETLPQGSTLARFFFKNGKRYCIEFVRK